MSRNIRRRSLLHGGAALGVALLAPAARACEFFSSNLRIIHPWTRASSVGATSAMVSMRFNDVAETDRLLKVETPVASGAEFGGEGADPKIDFAIPAGQESALTEAGIHVRLVGLQQPLEIGRSYPLTLTFEKGGVVSATLNVDYPSFRFK